VVRTAVVAAALLLCGCLRGAVYTHVTRPLTTNFDRTPVADGFVAKGDVKELRYNSYLRVIWDVNSIGALAKQEGLGELYYADLETFSVLGIWTQYRVHVYGRKREASP